MFKDLIQNLNEIHHSDCPLLDEHGNKKTGNISFKTQYIWQEPPVEESDGDEKAPKV